MTRRFGVNTYAYSQSASAADCVRRLAALGFTEFELMIMPGHLWPTDGEGALQGLRNALEGHTLSTLNTANLDINVAAAAEEMRDYSTTLLRRFIWLAGSLGAKGFVLGPGKANPLFPLPGATLEGYFFRALDILLPVAREAGVGLWVENMPFAFLPEAAGVMGALKRFGADDIGVCYDVANAHFIGEDPREGLRIVQERLELVHLSDTTRSAYRHAAVGRGDVDFAALAAPVAAASPHRLPMFEIIDEEPDEAMVRSADTLAAMGY